MSAQPPATPPPPPPPPRRETGRGAKLAIGLGVVVGLIVAVGVAAVATGTIRAFRAPSPSMEPTIHVGQHFLVARMSWPFSDPQRGDIVVFHPPAGADSQECGVPSQPDDGHPCSKPTPERSETSFIKRIVAMPGDELYIRGNHVYISHSGLDGPYKRQDEPFINSSPCDELCNLPKPITVPPGHFYMLGDNRGASDDSRDWGPVPRSALIGRKFLTY
jgi:signal peptidase I